MAYGNVRHHCLDVRDDRTGVRYCRFDFHDGRNAIRGYRIGFRCDRTAIRWMAPPMQLPLKLQETTLT